jgi:hypothetical protein
LAAIAQDFDDVVKSALAAVVGIRHPQDVVTLAEADERPDLAVVIPTVVEAPDIR